METLTRYTVAIRGVWEKSESVRAADIGQTERIERLEALKEAAEEFTARAALIDSLFGGDLPMVVTFLNCCTGSAKAAAYEHEDEDHYGMMTWPLYEALTRSINLRKALLQKGKGVAALYSLSTIDNAEVLRAFVEHRAPNIA